MILWMSLALAEPLDDWVDRTERAWQAAVAQHPDAAALADGVCRTSIELPQRTLIVDDQACEALRDRVVAGDVDALALLAIHLRTLSAEGRTLLHAPIAAPRPDTKTGPISTLGSPDQVVEAQELAQRTAAAVREAGAERWDADSRREGRSLSELLVLFVATAALVAFAVTLLAQRRGAAVGPPRPRTPASPTWPDTDEGRLRRRYATLFERLAQANGLEPSSLVDDELAEQLEGAAARAHARARRAVAPVAYGGKRADGARRADLAWAEDLLGEEP